MERQAEQALFVFLVVVIDLFLNVEKDLGLVGLGIVGKDVDDALLDADEDAIAAVAGMGQDERPQRKDLAGIGFALPAGPFQIGEGDRGFQLERRLRRPRRPGTPAGPWSRCRPSCRGPADNLPRRIQTDVGGGFEALGQQNRAGRRAAE